MTAAASAMNGKMKTITITRIVKDHSTYNEYSLNLALGLS